MASISSIQERILEYLYSEKNTIARTQYGIRQALGVERSVIEESLAILKNDGLIDFQGEYYNVSLDGIELVQKSRRAGPTITVSGNVGPGAVIGSGSVSARLIAGRDAGETTTLPNSFVPLDGNYKHPRADWGEMIDFDPIYGRSDELSTLEQWVVQDNCRLVTVLGMGGVGKTAVTVKLVQQIGANFDYIFWRDLRNAPLPNVVLDDCIKFLSDQNQVNLPSTLDGKILLLKDYLRKSRCLIVLDNSEAILKAGTGVGTYREQYESFGDLIRHVGASPHKSCLILTSREKPKDLIVLEGNESPVRSLHLDGLDEDASRTLLESQGLTGTKDGWSELIQTYSGHPLALRLVSSTIRHLFAGNVDSFLEEEEHVFGGIRDLLDEQFERLSDLEQTVMYWLTVEREPVSIQELKSDITYPLTLSKAILLDLLQSLRDRHIIEVTSNARFTLLPVVMEYMTSRLNEAISDEIRTGIIALFLNHALLKAQAKDYVMKSQVRLIIEPILENLLTSFSREGLTRQLNQILETLREAKTRTTGYAGGNVLNFLIRLGADLRGRDFSNMTVWQAHLRDRDLRDMDFSYSDLTGTAFTEAFGKIISVALSPDGEFLAAGTADSNVRLWKANSSEYLRTFVGHTDWVRAVEFSPDGKTLATGSCDNTVRLWDSATGELLRILKGHKRWVRALAFGPDGRTLISGSEDKSVRLWDTNSGKCIRTLEGHTDWVRAVAVSADGRLIASGGSDRILKLWSMDSGECYVSLELDNWVWALSFSPDSSILAVGSNDETIRLWNIENQTWHKTLNGHTNSVWALHFIRGGNLVSSSEDQTARIWDIDSGRCLKTLQGHTNSVRSVAASNDGRLILSGGEDHTVRLWNGITGQCIKVFQGFNSWIWSVASNSNGSQFATASNDAKVRLWDTGSRVCLKVFSGHKNPVWAVTFSPNDKLLASGGEDLSVRVWDINSGDCISTFEGHESWVRSVSFSPDTRLLASAASDQTIRIWELESSTCLHVLEGHTNPVWSAVFDPTGQLLVSASDDHTLRVWDVESGKCLNILRGHSKRVSSVTFNSNGSRIVSSSEDKTIKIWDLKAGICKDTLSGHTDWIRAAVFSPDDRFIASCSNDKTVRLWDTETGKCLRIMKGHKDRIRSVVFGLAGSVLVSGSDDETVRIWDVESGACLDTLRSDRPYERMKIVGATGISSAQRVSLIALGATDVEQ